MCLCWLLMCAPAPAAVTIVFDYSYDTNNFFTAPRRVLLERAAAEFTSRMTSTTWARIDPANTGGHYELAVINPSTMAITWATNVVIPTNQLTIRVGAMDFTKSPFPPMTTSTGDGASQLMSILNVSGNVTNLLANPALFRPVDASITFDFQGVRGFSSTVNRQWYFPTNADLKVDDRNPADPHYNDYTDFYDTVVHELGHVLGIHNPLIYQSILPCDPKFCAAWTSKIQSNGQGGYVFTGTHASQFYCGHSGANVPLETGTRCHWADGVRSMATTNWTSLSYERGRPYFRVPFSELEFGALQDLGYVITPVPKPTLSLAITNGNLNLRMNGLFPYLQCYLAVNADLTATNDWTNVQTLVPTESVASMTSPMPAGIGTLFLRLSR